MAEGMFLLLVFGAVLGPIRLLVNGIDLALPIENRRWAARAVGLTTPVALGLAMLGPMLKRLGFDADALGLAMALILLAGAFHSLFRQDQRTRVAAPAILTPSGVAALLLLPVAYPPRQMSLWMVLSAVGAVMGMNLVALFWAEIIRRRLGAPAIRLAAWTMAVLVCAFSIQSMSHSVTHLVCAQTGCPEDGEGDPDLLRAGSRAGQLKIETPDRMLNAAAMPMPRRAMAETMLTETGKGLRP